MVRWFRGAWFRTFTFVFRFVWLGAFRLIRWNIPLDFVIPIGCSIPVVEENIDRTEQDIKISNFTNSSRSRDLFV